MEIEPRFSWPTRIYWEDTDAGGVVYHARYVAFMERARTEWMRALGYGQERMRSEHGMVFAVRSMTMDFLIADPGLVKDIAPGTPVRFVFKAGEPGEYIVTGIEPLAGVATPEGTGGTGADGAGADGAAGSTAPGARDDHRGH